MKLFQSELTFEKRQKKHFIRAILCLLTVSLAPIGTIFATNISDSWQSLSDLRQAAKIFLEEKQVSADTSSIKVSIGRIDPRLRLSACDQPLDFFLPQATRKSGRVTVGVRCASPISWKLFVPAKVSRYQQAWVLQNTLSPSDNLSRADVKLQNVEINDRRKVPVTELNQLLNASPKKVLTIGTIIYQDNICLVCRGDKVTVTANNEFMSINVEAIAMSDATLGERIQVQNFNSKRFFNATVTGKNQLNINLSGIN